MIEEDDKRHQLYQKGLSDREIAQRIGLGRSAVTHWRRARGLRSQKEERKIVLEVGLSSIITHSFAWCLWCFRNGVPIEWIVEEVQRTIGKMQQYSKLTKEEIVEAIKESYHLEGGRVHCTRPKWELNRYVLSRSSPARYFCDKISWCGRRTYCHRRLPRFADELRERIWGD